MGRLQYSFRSLVIVAAIMPPLIYLGTLVVPEFRQSLGMKYWPSTVVVPAPNPDGTGPWFDATSNLEAVNRNRLHLAAWCAAAIASLALTVVMVAVSRKKKQASQVRDGRPRRDLDWLTGLRPR